MQQLKDGDKVWLKVPAIVQCEPMDNGMVYVEQHRTIMRVDLADLWTTKPNQSNEVLAKRIAELERENAELRQQLQNK